MIVQVIADTIGIPSKIGRAARRNVHPDHRRLHGFIDALAWRAGSHLWRLIADARSRGVAAAPCLTRSTTARQGVTTRRADRLADAVSCGRAKRACDRVLALALAVAPAGGWL
ncbi:hypothetical protein [Actinoplanes sp. DH11]|uniref:hypothetical protein n=1 Tax=Actinoplanes sp. DH11 TaxID=2857011 RepID=UPI001E47E47C|nr:hypothetical protein [Actinoplanes sp. DH11]